MVSQHDQFQKPTCCHPVGKERFLVCHGGNPEKGTEVVEGSRSQSVDKNWLLKPTELYQCSSASGLIGEIEGKLWDFGEESRVAQPVAQFTSSSQKHTPNSRDLRSGEQ